MKTTLKTGLFVLLLATAAGAHAEELGRLFFTPQQRAQLERGQQPNVDSPGHADSLTVSGVVQRHGGKRTVWINGVPQAAGTSDEHAPESVPVAVPGQRQPVKVKVGQKVLLDSRATQKPSRPAAPQHDDD